VVSLTWRWGGVSGECFMEPDGCLIVQGRDKPTVHKEGLGWPNLTESHPLISTEMNGQRTVKQVRAKLPEYQRRNVHIAFLGPNFTGR